MTNRLELNWKFDGFVDEQRYYCSETYIDPENLPVPKAVFANDVRTYVDTAIEDGKTYYVAVGSVKNSTEKLSAISKVYAIKNIDFFINLDATTNLADKSGRTWTTEGGASVTGGYLTLTNNGSLIKTPMTSNLSLASGDFTVRFIARSTKTTNQFILATTSKGNGWQIIFTNNSLQFTSYKNGWVTATDIVTAIPSGILVEHEYSVERKGSSIYIYIDGILANSASITNWDTSTSGYFYIGGDKDWASLSMAGVIKKIQVINGLAVGNGSSITPRI
jgi:hypothetical protein